MGGSSGGGWRPHAAWGAAAAFCAVAQFRLIMLVMGNGYRGSVAAALGVVSGQPHWKVYQSRILGPWLVEFLSIPLGDNYLSAHIVFTIVMTAAAGWLILHLTAGRYGNDAAWSAFFLFQALFALVLDKSWLYAWDHIGIVSQILFVSLVWSGKDWRWFAGLFAVSLFNHESALFIALWMVADPIVKGWFDRRPIRWTGAVVGLGGLLGGEAIILFLRNVLLVREIGPEKFNMPDGAGRDIQIQWAANWHFLAQSIIHFNIFYLLIPALLAGVTVLAVILGLRDPRRWLALSAVQIVIVLSILSLALLSETRVLLELVPFLAMGTQILRHEPRAAKAL